MNRTKPIGSRGNASVLQPLSEEFLYGSPERMNLASYRLVPREAMSCRSSGAGREVNHA